MSDLHRNSRFLRFLRSICSKTACARRAIVALFVAVATILATFMIMPSASMGASQQGEPKQTQTQAEKTENNTAADNKAAVQDGAAASGETAAKGDAGDSETKESNTAEPKNSQPSTNPDAPNANHAQNVDPTHKQKNAVEDVNKNPNQGVKKEESAKESRRQERAAEADARAANGSDEPPEACKKIGITELAKCYVAKYEFKGKKYVNITQPGGSYTVTPQFYRVTKLNSKGEPLGPTKVSYNEVEGFVKSFSLEGIVVNKKSLDLNDVVNNFVEVDQSGKITIHPNKWLRKVYHDVYVKVDYKDGSALTHPKSFTNQNGTKVNGYEEYSQFRVKIKYKGSEKNDLSLKVYDNKDSTTGKEVEDNGTAATVESDKDGKFSKITTPIFIDSQSHGKFDPIYHRMICHKDGDGTKDSDYYINSINGLTLSDSATHADSSTSQDVPPTQKRWKHVLGTRDTKKNPFNDYSGELYESDSDSIGERSQSWITGTPKEAGTFTCKVFALKDVGVSVESDKIGSHTFVSVFDSKINDSRTHLKQNLFDNNVKVEKIFSAYVSEADAKADLPYNPYGIFGTTYERKKVWDVKTIKIVFESKNKHLEVKDGDLKLNVYPFKNNDAGSGKPGASVSSALADGGTVSAMLGMELKPSIEATSEADSQKTITLKMLCSKGEEPQKTNAGGAGGTSNGVAAGGSGTTGNTDNKNLVYTKWEEPSKLGFNFPDENAQQPCTSKKDKQTCSLDGSTKNFAATTKASATFKPTETGDYKCVVYALKPDALDKFNAEVAKTGVTPSAISAAFAAANLTANKNLAKLTINIHVPEKFTLPHTGEWNWNLQLGAIAAVMVSVLAAGFVASQSDSYRKLFYERRRC